MTRRNPWGFAINYDQEIRWDERLISELKRMAPLSALLPEGWACLTAALLACHSEAAAKVIGITAEEAAALACYLYIDEALWFGESARSPEGYQRGKIVNERVESSWGDDWILPEAKRVATLKAAKARLARHRRNKAKHGA